MTRFAIPIRIFGGLLTAGGVFLIVAVAFAQGYGMWLFNLFGVIWIVAGLLLLTYPRTAMVGPETDSPDANWRDLWTS